MIFFYVIEFLKNIDEVEMFRINILLCDKKILILSQMLRRY